MRRPNPVRVTLGVAGAAVVIGVTAVVSASEASVPASKLVHGQRSHPAAIHSARISAHLTRDFAVFSRQADDAGAAPLPPIPSDSVSLYGLDTADTQFVQNGAVSVWLVPGSSGACIVLRDPTAGGPVVTVRHCESSADIAQYGLHTGFQALPQAASAPQSRRHARSHLTQPASTEVVAALVPNGNTAVGVAGAAGTQASVAPLDNVAVAVVPAGDATLTYQSATGTPASTTIQFASGA
jgi:hypothetical protein